MHKHSEIENYFNKLELFWEDFIEVLPIGMVAFDKKWRIKTINKSFIDFLSSCGKGENYIGKYILDDECFNESFPMHKIFQLSKGKHFEEKIENNSFKSNSISLVLKGSPIYKNRNFEGGILIAEDFKVSDNSFSDKLSTYQSIALASSDATFKLNMHGNIKFWTDDAIKFFQIQEDEIDKKFIGKLFPKIDEVYFERIRKDLAFNQKWNGKFKFENGQKSFWTNIKIVLTSDKNNLVVYCNYISESQERIEKAKQEEIQFFKETVLKSNEMILQIDPHGIISYVNEKFCEKFGYEIDEIRGVVFSELIDNKFKIEYKIQNLFSIVSDKKFDIIPLVSKMGDIINVCPNFNITHDGTALKYYTVYLHECKKERKVISLIAESLLNDSKEAIAILLKDKIIRANPQFLELIGFEKEEDAIHTSVYTFICDVKKKNIDDILLGDMGENIFKCETKFRKKIEVEIKKINKSSKEEYSVLLFKPTYIQDLIPIKKNNYVESLANSLNEFLWTAKVINNEIHIEFISHGISKVTGYSQMEFISDPTFWKKIIHPNELKNANESLIDFFSNPKKTIDEFTYRIIKKDGSTIWVSCKIKIIRDDKGMAVKAYGSASDVTIKALENLKLKTEINELQTKNKTKDKFISIISHDLRSPFTSILGFTELIATDTTLTKEEIIEYVSNIRDASQNTLNLVNSLLDWTRLQTGRVEIAPKIVNANYLVKKTIVTLSGVAYQKGLTLSSQIDESFFINADENILTQVFNNLVSNSLKFTPKGGSINIEAEKLENQQKIKFTVSDTGVGIDEKDIPKLFLVDKKFTTLGTEGEKGTGLGLSLVKEIIEKHNGEIFVKSELGKGTKFVFTIPISSPIILLLDNAEVERNLYSKLIESITEGIEIYKAENTIEAEKIIKEKMPMLIITEHKLGKTTGLKFIEKISNSDIKYKPPFILLSRDVDKNIVKDYKQLEVFEVFAKPVDLKKFKAAIDKTITLT